ncbi:hypothetical protein ACLMAJ_18925 [Nocardia sp. KC 131]
MMTAQVRMEILGGGPDNGHIDDTTKAVYARYNIGELTGHPD